jgi:hypothetical protein
MVGASGTFAAAYSRHMKRLAGREREHQKAIRQPFVATFIAARSADA